VELNIDAFRKLPAGSPERQMDILTMAKREAFPGSTFLSDEVMDYFVESFEATGFTGGLNWYRNIGVIATLANPNWRVKVPCLYVGAEHDVILRPSSADGMEDFIGDLEKYTVMDCGHWTQQGKPEELNRTMIDWPNRKIKA
jgi:epoxide hydrolase A/B